MTFDGKFPGDKGFPGYPLPAVTADTEFTRDLMRRIFLAMKYPEPVDHSTVKKIPPRHMHGRIGSRYDALRETEVLVNGMPTKQKKDAPQNQQKDTPQKQREQLPQIEMNIWRKAMDEKQFPFELIFKPCVPGLKIGPEESRLLLAFAGEILKKMLEEEGKKSED